MIGLFEPVCAPWNVGGIPDDFSFGEIAARLGSHGRRTSRRRWRACRSRWTSGVKKFFCGPESFTPDLQPIVGEAPELKNYFVAAGLNSIGILTGGGLGRVLAHWIINGRPDVDVTGIQHRSPAHATRPTPSTGARAPSSRSAWSTSATTRRARCRPRAARSGRRSTTGSRRAARTSATSAAGRAPTGTRRAGAKPSSSSCRGAARTGSRTGRPSTSAAREGVILMDMSFMSKFLVAGTRRRAAARTGSRANNVDGDAGHHHVHAVAQRGAASSRPTSPSPSSTTSSSGSSRPTPRTATSRPG